MKAFQNFVGSRLVFFHNAPFETGFLKKATSQTRLRFANPIRDATNGPCRLALTGNLQTDSVGGACQGADAVSPSTGRREDCSGGVDGRSGEDAAKLKAEQAG